MAGGAEKTGGVGYLGGAAGYKRSDPVGLEGVAGAEGGISGAGQQSG